jgi:hypothetical protein
VTLVAFWVGTRAILRGTIIEPPAAVMEPVLRFSDRMMQRLVERFPVFRSDDRDARA